MTSRFGRSSSVILACSLATIVWAGCRQKDALPAEDLARQTIQLRSPAFADGGMIPKASTCDGSDRSPPLEWSGVPAQAQSLVLICDDPDAPMGTWSHWVVFNLAREAKALNQGVPPEETIAPATDGLPGSAAGKLPQARQGTNDFGKIGYRGPCPPGGTHRYFFRLYALDTRLELSSSATRKQVLKAVEGHILAEGTLIGKYKRS